VIAPPKAPPPPAGPPVPRSRLRLACAVLSLIAGIGLLGGAAVGTWLSRDASPMAGEERIFDERRALWRELPVDEIFPPEVAGEGAGPGGADRRWLRIAAAPDGGCEEALDPELHKVLDPAGCHRLLRASYADDTGTSVTTVGLLFTEADPAETARLRQRFAEGELTGRTDLLPRHFVPDGTFEDRPPGRATWTVRVLADVPVVLYAVTGFADGRGAGDPQPAADATASGQGTVAALAGLGHDAEGIADRIERRLRKAAQETAGDPAGERVGEQS
jgi:hypothetical protein